MLFLAIPSFLACLLFGRLMVAAIYQSGRFGAVDAWLVSIVLAIYSLGLVPSSSARLLQNAFFVIGDTSTPAKIAVARIVAMAVLALPLMHVFDRIELARLVTNLGDEAHGLFLGAAGLALSSAVVSWAELAALVVRLRRHYGPVRLPWRRSLPLSTMALLASAAAGGVWWVLPQLHPLVEAVLVLGMFAVVYLGTARLLRLRELEELLPGRRS